MLGEILAIASLVTFVLSNVFFRKIDRDVSPAQINAVRTSIGAISFVAIALLQKQFRLIFAFPPILYLWLILSIVSGQVIGDTAFFQAQKKLGTTLALAIATTFPVFSTIFSVVFLNKFIPYTFYIAIGLVVIGVITLGFGKARQEKKAQKQTVLDTHAKQPITEEPSSTGQIELVRVVKPIKTNPVLDKNTQIITKKERLALTLAIMLGFVASLSWAAGIVLTEYAIDQVTLVTNMSESSSLLANIVRFPIAADILLLMSIQRRKGKNYDERKKMANWSKKTWSWLFLGSIVGTSIGAYLYTEATNLAGAVVVSIIASASPLVSIPISWTINKERINLLGVLGVFLTMGGVIIVLVS